MSQSIIILVAKETIPGLVNHHLSIQDGVWGVKYWIGTKVLKKAVRNDRIYFLCENQIIAYGSIFEHVVISDGTLADYGIELATSVGRVMVLWRNTFWYKEPIKYERKILPGEAKYFNLERVLKNEPEPAIRKTQWT